MQMLIFNQLPLGTCRLGLAFARKNKNEISNFQTLIVINAQIIIVIISNDEGPRGFYQNHGQVV